MEHPDYTYNQTFISSFCRFVEADFRKYCFALNDLIQDSIQIKEKRKKLTTCLLEILAIFILKILRRHFDHNCLIVIV